MSHKAAPLLALLPGLGQVQESRIGLLHSVDSKKRCLTSTTKNSLTFNKLYRLFGNNREHHSSFCKVTNNSCLEGGLDSFTCLCLVQQTLVEYGANVTMQNQAGEKPSQSAERHGHTLCSRYLVVVETCMSLASQVVKLTKQLKE